jgi:hypothetical protein
MFRGDLVERLGCVAGSRKERIVSSNRDGARRILLDADLDEMELIGGRTFSVAVAVDADPEFKTYIMAAGSTHAMGNRSIDNILRRNYTKWVQFFQNDRLAHESDLVGLRRKIARKATSRCAEISELNIGGEVPAGVISAANVLIRLESSFRAASQLIQLGFAFESEAVIRLGFEQVAWSYAIRRLATTAEVISVSGTGHMSLLKSIFPGAGRVYGRLSELAHVDPGTHSRFVVERDGEREVRIKAPSVTRESVFLLLILLDAFLVITEQCFKGNGLLCESINPTTCAVLGHRPASLFVGEFGAVLPRDAEPVFASWWT